MKTVIKLAGALLFLGAGSVHANLLNFTLTGSVDAFADAGNAFGLSLNDPVTATGTFDDSVLSGGTGDISFGMGSGNSITLNIGTQTFVASDDTSFASGSPTLSLVGGAFAGLNFDADFQTLGYFSSLDQYFDGEDDSANLISGTWTSISTTPVPVPAALWLFTSGLVGLTSIGRRKI